MIVTRVLAAINGVAALVNLAAFAFSGQHWFSLGAAAFNAAVCALLLISSASNRR